MASKHLIQGATEHGKGFLSGSSKVLAEFAPLLYNSRHPTHGPVPQGASPCHVLSVPVVQVADPSSKGLS
eukprot:scaffold648326_cov51-Prasinocladus_malaysianus.AAC.1